ncbi:hypothetical protein HMPREF9231_1294 [Gardnerella vaginalis HMP9231]|nr:hypothetical protein HMPREF9231_1294 [Gardnerella vaginalis HMP9231]
MITRFDILDLRELCEKLQKLSVGVLSFYETRTKIFDFNNLSVLDSSFVKRKSG